MTPSLDYLGHIRPPTSLSSFLVLLGSFVRDIVHYPRRGEEMRARRKRKIGTRSTRAHESPRSNHGSWVKRWPKGAAGNLKAARITGSGAGHYIRKREKKRRERNEGERERSVVSVIADFDRARHSAGNGGETKKEVGKGKVGGERRRNFGVAWRGTRCFHSDGATETEIEIKRKRALPAR